MKGSERETKKNLSVKEWTTELAETDEKLSKLRLKHRVTPLANPAELRMLRRHAARLRTWINIKQETVNG